jgi:putative Ca2+/H+ antiporter (TMEM165/GDT1 family)
MRKFYEYMAEKAALNASYHYQMAALHLTGFSMCVLLAVLTYLSTVYFLTIILGCVAPIFLIMGIWNWIEGTVDEEDARTYRAMGGNSWKTFLN